MWETFSTFPPKKSMSNPFQLISAVGLFSPSVLRKNPSPKDSNQDSSIVRVPPTLSKCVELASKSGPSEGVTHIAEEFTKAVLLLKSGKSWRLNE